MKHTTSLFLKKAICFLGFFINFLCSIKGEGTVAAVPPRGILMPITPLRALLQGNPFDGFPYGLRAAKHHAALRLSLHSRWGERSPLKIPLRDNYPFLVLCVECSNDSTGPLCAAPARGVPRGVGFSRVFVTGKFSQIT